MVTKVTSYGAVAPGTDLPRYARQLVRMHDKVLGGGTPALAPRPLVSRSWSRMLALGLDADGRNARTLHGPAQVEALRRESPLHLVIDDLRRVLTSVADASLFVLVVTDADGVILWREGCPVVLRQADALGFDRGARWAEECVGTNAIGTALAEAAPVQLFSGEHFEQTQHPWYCTAYPIHDPRGGRLLGIVDVSGPALTLHPAIGALVESAVLLAQSRLWQRHQQALERLRVSAAAAVAGAGGPALVVDDNGWVASSVGVAAGDRIAAPRAAQALVVPGLGVCLPERIGGGWLVRPASRPSRVVARLRTGRDPALWVDGGDETWCTPLTERHAQLLAMLHAAGPDGMTPRQLSLRIFGDEEHLVTVRAEVSRMRRRLGALVDPSPYRIAAGVTLTVQPEPGPPGV